MTPMLAAAVIARMSQPRSEGGRRGRIAGSRRQWPPFFLVACFVRSDAPPPSHRHRAERAEPRDQQQQTPRRQRRDRRSFRDVHTCRRGRTVGRFIRVTALVAVTLLPGVMPTTFTLKLQTPLAGSVAPVRLTVAVDPGALIVPPPQEPVSPF